MEVHPTAHDVAVLLETQAYGLAKSAIVSRTQHAAAVMVLDVQSELEHRGHSAPAARHMIRTALTEGWHSR